MRAEVSILRPRCVHFQQLEEPELLTERFEQDTDGATDFGAVELMAVAGQNQRQEHGDTDLDSVVTIRRGEENAHKYRRNMGTHRVHDQRDQSQRQPSDPLQTQAINGGNEVHDDR